MRLLLTGANGFTGPHFAKAAQAQGFTVFPLQADLTDAPALLAEVGAVRPTHVVHLAGLSAVTHADEDAFYQVNLFGTLNLLKALTVLPSPPEKVLLASSANVYGNYEGGPITELVCPRPVNQYAMSKLAMEHMAMTYLDRLPLIVVRPFNYTGVGHDLRFVMPKIVDHFVRRAPVIELGNLDVYREYNDVREICQSYVKLLQLGVPGDVYNVCSGRAVSLHDVLTTMTEITGWAPEVVVNPDYVRANEIHVLCGSDQKLRNCTGMALEGDLKSLLRWMFETLCVSSGVQSVLQ